MIDDSWLLFDKTKNLSDNIIDIIFFENNLYLSTNDGVQIFSTIINKPIGKIDAIKFKIRDLELINNQLYIISDYGFYISNLKENYSNKISDSMFEKISIDDNRIFLIQNNKVIEYIKEGEKHSFKRLFNFSQIANVDICDNYIWVHNKNKAAIYSIHSKELLEYDYLDGIPGSIINNLECDSDWVWFTTNNGFAFYNWRKYHHENY